MNFVTVFGLSFMITLVATQAHLASRPAEAATPATFIAEEVSPLVYALRCDHAPPGGFDAMVVNAARQHGLDPRIVAVTVYRESGCAADSLGSSGEIGLGQVLPSVWLPTLAEAGIARTEADLWDPATNLNATAFILATLNRRAGGDLFETFRRYNGAGPAAYRYAREQMKALTLGGVQK